MLAHPLDSTSSCCCQQLRQLPNGQLQLLQQDVCHHQCRSQKEDGDRGTRSCFEAGKQQLVRWQQLLRQLLLPQLLRGGGGDG